MSLSPDELTRYARHLTLAEVGVAGQERLKAARVLIVGAGGLGSPAALYLAAAGVGTIGIVDADRVDLTNLQRQILHGTASIGFGKAASAADRLEDLNPTVTVVPHPVRLTAANAAAVIRDYDLVVDGSDNFPTRYLINDVAVLAGKPVVHAAIFRFSGQVSVLGAPGGPCYRCLYPEPPEPGLIPNCAEAGVLGVLPGVVGSLQATEVLKWILGLGQPLVGRLLLYDGLAATTTTIAVRRDPRCALCGDAPTIVAPSDLVASCDPAEPPESLPAEIAVADLVALRAAGSVLQIVDVREGWEVAIARFPDARVVPLGDLPARLADLDPALDVITVCHHGQRSLVAQRFLAAAGFRARSLAGGIDAWAATVDPTLSRY